MIKLFTRPRKASTLIILRETFSQEEPFEVLMLLRHRNNKFVPSRHVFPGGAMDEQDKSPDFLALCAGLSPETAANMMPDAETPDYAFASWITAVRETFEESALLYAYQADGNWVSFDDEAAANRFAIYRKHINQQQMTFGEMLKQEKLMLATDRIGYFSHWITPIFSPIRYDTRFFLAQVPPHQTVKYDRYELAEQNWITPAEALKLYAQGSFRMVLPTVATLTQLCKYKNIQAVINEINP